MLNKKAITHTHREALNRKGADKILSVYWFAVLFLVASGVFGMVYVFYKYPFDVREMEGQIITNRISECISHQGVLASEWIDNSDGTESTREKIKIRDKCNLDFSSEFDNEQYYVRVDFYDMNNFKIETKDETEKILSSPMKTIFDGNENLKSDCEIQTKKDFERQAKCFEEKFYAVDEKNNHLIIKITSAVRKTEKNAF